MNQRTTKYGGISFLSLIFYVAIVLISTIVGGIHPILYIFMTVMVGALAWIPYVYLAVKHQNPGVATIMNLVVVIAFAAFGGLANLLLVSVILFTLLAEISRKVVGYNTYKGIAISYTFLTLSHIGSPLYVWIYPTYAISEAAEEISVQYSELLAAFTSPAWFAAVIISTIFVAWIMAMLAKVAYKKLICNCGIV